MKMKSLVCSCILALLALVPLKAEASAMSVQPVDSDWLSLGPVDVPTQKSDQGSYCVLTVPDCPLVGSSNCVGLQVGTPCGPGRICENRCSRIDHGTVCQCLPGLLLSAASATTSADDFVASIAASDCDALPVSQLSD